MKNLYTVLIALLYSYNTLSNAITIQPKNIPVSFLDDIKLYVSDESIKIKNVFNADYSDDTSSYYTLTITNNSDYTIFLNTAEIYKQYPYKRAYSVNLIFRYARLMKRALLAEKYAYLIAGSAWSMYITDLWAKVNEEKDSLAKWTLKCSLTLLLLYYCLNIVHKNAYEDDEKIDYITQSLAERIMIPPHETKNIIIATTHGINCMYYDWSKDKYSNCNDFCYNISVSI